MAFFDLITNCLFSWWWLFVLKGVLHIQDAFTWKPVLSPCPFEQTVNLGKRQERVRDRKAWPAAVHAVAKSRTRVGEWTTESPLAHTWAAALGAGSISHSSRYYQVTLLSLFPVNSHQQKKSLHCFMSMLTLGINFCQQGQFEILSAYFSFYLSEY